MRIFFFFFFLDFEYNSPIRVLNCTRESNYQIHALYEEQVHVAIIMSAVQNGFASVSGTRRDNNIRTARVCKQQTYWPYERCASYRSGRSTRERTETNVR